MKDEDKTIMQDRIFSEPDMLRIIEDHCQDRLQVQAALALMQKAHAGQYRKGPGHVPYISHPLTMACQAIALHLDSEDLLSVILLHDVVEDTPFTAEDLPVGDAARKAISLLTKPEHYDNNSYYPAIAADPLAAITKLLDRCQNLSFMAAGFTPEKMMKYIKETEDYVYPLLEAVKQNYPEYKDAAFILEYQMRSITETVSRLLFYQPYFRT